MSLGSQTLTQLAEHYGISTDFWDWKGNHTKISEDSIITALGALDVDVSSPELAEAALAEAELKPWRQVVPPCVVTENTKQTEFKVHVPAGQPVEVIIKTEDGLLYRAIQVDNYEPDREVDGVLIGEASFMTPPNLPLGYHSIIAKSGQISERGTLIVSPSFLGFPRSMGDRRIWGLAAQLYSARSASSWGVGDFQDLADLCVWSTTKLDADYLLINPVHAAQPVSPMDPSPYLPSSRRFVNPMYIRPEIIREYSALPQSARDEIEKLRFSLGGELARMDDENVPEHSGVPSSRIYRNESWESKIQALKIIYDHGLRPVRQMAFDNYVQREGQALLDFATWCALYVEFDGLPWQEWPKGYRTPTSVDIGTFQEEHQEEINFYLWMQWVADLQLSSAQRNATDNGMAIGIVTDLAVGVNGSGADTWTMGSIYAKDVTVGAPPDAYNQLGQDWGQPPWRPDRLEELAYEPYRRMIEANLRHSGGVRVDHILGLFRLWWVPKGKLAKDGVYVRYNHEAMVGVLALEAYRHGALVIGEDLGTVEPWVRDYLSRRGILGTSVLWFESGQDGKPLAPENWREYCMASVTTHDLPPSAGYLAGDHIRLRHRLGLLTESLDEELRKDAQSQQAWIGYLHELGLLDEDEDDSTANVVLAMHRFLNLTQSRVLNATLTDAVGDRFIQNQPGTIDEYPNWRVPLSDKNGNPILLEDVFNLERPLEIAALLNGYDEDDPNTARK